MLVRLPNGTIIDRRVFVDRGPLYKRKKYGCEVGEGLEWAEWVLTKKLYKEMRKWAKKIPKNVLKVQPSAKLKLKMIRATYLYLSKLDFPDPQELPQELLRSRVTYQHRYKALGNHKPSREAQRDNAAELLVAVACKLRDWCEENQSHEDAILVWDFSEGLDAIVDDCEALIFPGWYL